MLTGESMPINKKEGDLVIGGKFFFVLLDYKGTINQQGMIHIKATRVGSETALAQIVKLVEDAQTSKAPIQKVADRISGIFVPVVLTIALVTFVIWMSLTNVLPKSWTDPEGGVFLFAFLKAIAVLVIAWYDFFI